MNQQTNRVHNHLGLVLTPGTQVVSLVEVHEGDRLLHPIGAVAVIVKAPTDLEHSYRVRFIDGFEAALKSHELIMLAKYKEGDIGDVSTIEARQDLYERIIYRCVIGSRAYGLETEESDVDYRGIYLPPAKLHWSLYGVPEQLEREATQEAYWEIQKFIVLALKANPNVLECLYSPLVEKQTALAGTLLEQRSMFLSKLVYQTFNGYVMSQFKKMQADIRNQGAVKWKHVMHLLRLLMSGIHVLKTHDVQVRVDHRRDHLLAIRRGELSWEDTERFRKELHVQFEDAFRSTTLPERPDYQRANDFLVTAREAALERDLP
jgi:predicted nucleotidyltransferase